MDGLRTLEGITLWTPDSPSERAGIVTVLPAPRVSVKLVFDRLRAEGITISLREGKLRYSPHFYNSSSDMRRVVALTAKALL
jgi:selenocysteine lyase/cysteine desulfurase